MASAAVCQGPAARASMDRKTPKKIYTQKGLGLGGGGSVADMLRDSRWSKLRWHAFRWGGGAACYHRGPHLKFLMWWGRWRRLQTALEHATRYSDPEVVGLLLPVADTGVFVGIVVEVPVMDLWLAAMYAKEMVAIKELDILPAAGNGEPARAREGSDGEPSDSESSTSSSESFGLLSNPLDAKAKKSDVGKRTEGSQSGKRVVGTCVVGVRSAAGHQTRGSGQAEMGTHCCPKSAGRAAGVKSAPRRWRLPAVGGAVRVHGPVQSGPKVVLGGGPVGSRPAARGRLRGRIVTLCAAVPRGCVVTGYAASLVVAAPGTLGNAGVGVMCSCSSHPAPGGWGIGFSSSRAGAWRPGCGEPPCGAMASANGSPRPQCRPPCAP